MITHDATSNSGFLDDRSSLTWSHTCTGANLLTVSIVTFDASGAFTVTGVTYDGVAMTQAIQETANEGVSSKRRVSAVYYLLNPSSGADDVVVTLSGSTADCAGAVAFSFIGVKGVSPLDDTDGDNSSSQQTKGSISLTAEKNDSLVIDSFIADTTDIPNPSVPTRTGYVEITNATEEETMGASYTIGDDIGATTYEYSVGGTEYMCYTGALFNPAPIAGAALLLTL